MIRGALTDAPFLGFERSLDLYGDGSVVLVGMPGHTPGSVGLYLRNASGREFLFCGDIVWNAQALANAAPKMRMARRMADADAEATQTQIDRLHRLQQERPEITIVPAHDAQVQSTLAYFPDWVD